MYDGLILMIIKFIVLPMILLVGIEVANWMFCTGWIFWVALIVPIALALIYVFFIYQVMGVGPQG